MYMYMYVYTSNLKIWGLLLYLHSKRDPCDGVLVTTILFGNLYNSSLASIVQSLLTTLFNHWIKCLCYMCCKNLNNNIMVATE